MDRTSATGLFTWDLSKTVVQKCINIVRKLYLRPTVVDIFKSVSLHGLGNRLIKQLIIRISVKPFWLAMGKK